MTMDSGTRDYQPVQVTKAWFKRRILHAPNQIVELSAGVCDVRRLNQLNLADMSGGKREFSRMFDCSSFIAVHSRSLRNNNVKSPDFAYCMRTT